MDDKKIPVLTNDNVVEETGTSISPRVMARVEQYWPHTIKHLFNRGHTMPCRGSIRALQELAVRTFLLGFMVVMRS